MFREMAVNQGSNSGLALLSGTSQVNERDLYERSVRY